MNMRAELIVGAQFRSCALQKIVAHKLAARIAIGPLLKRCGASRTAGQLADRHDEDDTARQTSTVFHERRQHAQRGARSHRLLDRGREHTLRQRDCNGPPEKVSARLGCRVYVATPCPCLPCTLP